MKLKFLLLVPFLLLAGCDRGVNSGMAIDRSQLVWHGKYNEVYRIEDKDVTCWITESRTQTDSAGISCLPKTSISQTK